MSEDKPPSPDQTPIPDGFRSGAISAITVILGFSLLFFRSWAFELPGEWNASGAAAGVLLLLSITLQLVALWRALQPKDRIAAEYHRTLRWFLSAVVVLLISLIVAAFSYSELIRL